MSRRRKVSAKRFSAAIKAIPWDYKVQALEPRLLFTTFQDPTPAGQFAMPNPFEYEAEGGGVMRIAYHDVTFEAIGVSVDPTTNATTVGNLIPGGITAPAAPVLPFNLFTIYVTRSAPDSYITVAPVARLTLTPPPGIRADLPFGVGHPLLVFPADGLGLPYTVTPGTGIGAGVLGAFTLAAANGAMANIPIVSVQDAGPLGVYPGNAFGDNTLHAGFDVAANASDGAPQDFNAFKFAGEVFGNVAVSGNIQMFYAGALLTGDATGIRVPVPGAPVSAFTTPNFSVGGDLRDLITAGDIGGDPGNAAAGGFPNYDTGFTGAVGGKIGQVNELTGGFFGTMNVTHNSGLPGFTDLTPEQEIEYKNTGTSLIGDPGGIGQIFQGDTNYLGTVQPQQLPAPFTNDTPATAQYLGSGRTVDGFGNLVVTRQGLPVFDTEVQGTLQNAAPLQAANGDPADWYAVSLLAGQNISISVTGGSENVIIAEVMDPDGRLIASDITSIASGQLQIKPDRPGIYRIGMIPNGTAAKRVDLSYLLTITGTGDQGFGVLATGGQVSDMGLDSFLTVQKGNFGGVVSGQALLSATSGPTPSTSSAGIYAPASIVVSNGNLGAVIATTIGVGNNTALTGLTFTDPLYLSVPNGSAGLIQATSNLPNGVLSLETQFDPNYRSTPILKTDDQFAHAIGGSIQVIDAAATFACDIGTNGGIGTIHAANMATNPASYIEVNADNIGSDGIIDLIDVTGNLGTLAYGGPGIVTNQGGDVRYMSVGGLVFRNEFFGGGENNAVIYPAGQSATLTDASGNVLTFTPVGPITTTVTTTTITPLNGSSGSSTTNTGTSTSGPQITLLSYGILDKGGQIPISVSSTGSMAITDSGTNGSEVNIGSVSITGTGSPIVNLGTDPYGNATITQTAPVTTTSTGSVTLGPTTTTNPDGSTVTVTQTISGGGTTTALTLTLGGPEVINVLNVSSSGSATLIQNNTLGEIASLTAPAIGQILTRGNLGYTTPRATPAAVMPRTVIAGGNSYPFAQQHTGVVIGSLVTNTGSAVNIDAYGGIGNVLVFGTLQSLIANYAVSTGIKGAAAIPGQFDGIVGPIVAGRPDMNITTFGSILNVDIGQGVLPTGTGLVGFSGIFASGSIGLVTNAGNPGSSIRGNIISEDDAHIDLATGLTFAGTAIGQISLTNGSIISSRIETIYNWVPGAFYDNFIVTNDLSTVSIVLPGFEQSPFLASYSYEIGSIYVTGLGGIIGARIEATNIGPILVANNGFGVLETTIASAGNGHVAGITASGYGIRNTTISDEGYLGPVVASGGGPSISVLTYPVDVRESDIANTVDPYFGVTPNVLTDLNAALGTSASQPDIPNVTDTGVIEDCVLQGGISFAGLVAQKVRTALPVFSPVTLPNHPTANIPVIGSTFPMEINFADSVGNIRIFQLTDGLQITTGHLIGFSPSTSVSRVGISVAGTINTLSIHGNFGQYITDPATGVSEPDSYINAGGPSGTIKSLTIYGTLNGNVIATGTIGKVLITQDVEGSITAMGQTTGLALSSLRVLGGIRDGSLTLDGSVGSIIVNGTLGTSAGSLTVHGNANLISVGADHKRLNSDLALALSVTGTLRTLMVHGRITGSVTTGGDLTNLNVTADGTTAVIVSGNISVGGRINSAIINNGSIGSSIIATGAINSFVINRGNLLVPGVVESVIDSIRSFTITGGLAYGLYGSLLAQSGRKDRIDISGNLGDGINTALVTTLSGTTFRVRGSIADHASVQVTGALNLLQVDGSIQTGAIVAAHPLLKEKIKGTNTGTITIV